MLTAMAALAQASRAASIAVNVRATDTLLPLSGISVDLYKALPYRFGVYAVDLGGNRQTSPAVNRLRVR